MCSIDIVIPCYNENIDQIASTIESCINQSIGVDNIYLVDDGSDKSFIISDNFAKYNHVHIIRHEINKGQASARNTGLSRSNSEFIAFIDVDVNISKNWIETCKKYIERNKNVAGCCTRIRKIDNSILTKWSNRFLEPRYEHDLGSYEVPSCTGHAVMFEKSLIKKINGYDEIYKGVYEDADVCIRLRREGFEIHVVEGAYIDYNEENSLESLSYRTLRNSGWDTSGRYVSNPALSPVSSPITELNQTYWMIHRVARNIASGRIRMIPVDIKVWLESIRIMSRDS